MLFIIIRYILHCGKQIFIDQNRANVYKPISFFSFPFSLVCSAFLVGNIFSRTNWTRYLKILTLWKCGPYEAVKKIIQINLNVDIIV